MKTIWKYPLVVTSIQKVVMPAGAKALTVNDIAGEIFMWVEVKSKNQLCSRWVHIFGTGHPMDTYKTGKPLEYVGTVLQHNGELVWHVYIEAL